MMHLRKPAFPTVTYKRMFWKHYMQYALIFLALLFVMMLLSAHFTRVQRQESVKQAAAALSGYADSVITEAQRLAVNIGRNESFRTLSSSDTAELDFTQLDSTVFFTAQKNLVSFKALNRRIESLSIRLYGHRYVISDSGTITLDSFYQSAFNADPEEDPEYLNPLGPRKFRFLAQGSIVKGQTPAHPMLILSLINNNTTHYGNLFLSLDEHQMEEDLAALISDDMEYFLLDADHQLILSNSGQTDAGLPDGVLKQDSRFASTADSLSGWLCTVGYSDAFVKRQLRNQLLLFSGLFLLILLGLFPLTHLICSRNYAPIHELSSIVGAGSTDTETEMEYEALKKAIQSVFENKALLEEQILIYRPLLINSLLLDLLDSTRHDYASPLSGLKSLGIVLPFPVWQCISVITDNAAPGFLERICRDISSENTVCVFISYRRRQGALVLNSSDNRSADDACKRLADRLEREEQILAFGTGCTSGDVRLASVSYEQSQNALDYLALRPAGKGISFDSVNQAGARSVRRPSGLDNLEVVFSAGHFEEGERLLMEYLDGACSGGFVRKSYLLYARDRLLSAVQKLRESQKLSFDEERLAQFQPEKPSSYEEFYGLVLTVCRELESLSASQEEQAVSDSSRQILRFLEEHLCDEMFSLSQLAAAFGLSESMMSRRVKQLTGQTFLAYVTQKRIDLACRLLATTDMSVLSVAKASGYENDITFRRLFKKYMRVTPGEYRSQFPS